MLNNLEGQERIEAYRIYSAANLACGIESPYRKNQSNNLPPTVTAICPHELSVQSEWCVCGIYAVGSPAALRHHWNLLRDAYNEPPYKGMLFLTKGTLVNPRPGYSEREIRGSAYIATKALIPHMPDRDINTLARILRLRGWAGIPKIVVHSLQLRIDQLKDPDPAVYEFPRFPRQYLEKN